MVETFYLSTVSGQPAKCVSCPTGCLTCNKNGCLHCLDGFYPLPIQQNEPLNQTLNINCTPCTQVGCISCISNVFCQLCT